jgi:hypothetical protein
MQGVTKWCLLGGRSGISDSAAIKLATNAAVTIPVGNLILLAMASVVSLAIG